MYAREVAVHVTKRYHGPRCFFGLCDLDEDDTRALGEWNLVVVPEVFVTRENVPAEAVSVAHMEAIVFPLCHEGSMLAYMENIEILGTKDTDGLGFDVVICVQAPLVLAIWLTLATRHAGGLLVSAV